MQQPLAHNAHILFILPPTFSHVAQFFLFAAQLRQFSPQCTIDIWLEKPHWLRDSITKQQHQLATTWLANNMYVSHLYALPASNKKFLNNLAAATNKQYSAIVPLMPLRPLQCARLAKKINKHATIIGFFSKPTFSFLAQQVKKLVNSYNIIADTPFMVQHYKNQCSHILPHATSRENTKQFILKSIPRGWICYAKLRFLKWNIEKKSNIFGQVIALDLHTSAWKNRWSPKKILELITFLKKQDPWNDTSFIVFCPTKKIRHFSKYFGSWPESKIFLCSPTANVFQLPAITHLCDIIISAHDGGTGLYANLFQIPTITLHKRNVYTQNDIFQTIKKTKNRDDLFVTIAKNVAELLKK